MPTYHMPMSLPTLTLALTLSLQVSTYHMPCLFGSDEKVMVMTNHAALAAQEALRFAGPNPDPDPNPNPSPSPNPEPNPKQFALKHPQLSRSLTLSKIRAIKRELLSFAQEG